MDFAKQIIEMIKGYLISKGGLLVVAIGFVIWLITEFAKDSVKATVLNVIKKIIPFQFGFKVQRITGTPYKSTRNKILARRILLEKYKTKLYSKKKILISGLGGVGKTYTAKMLYEKLTKTARYKQIGWIYCNGDSLLEKIVNDINIFPNISSVAQRTREIRDFFNNADSKVLLFLDNVTDETLHDPFFRELLASDISLVLTSRKPTIDQIEGMPLTFLTEKEAVRLFYQYYGKKKKKEDINEVRKIVNLVNGHALMVELLAKSIEPSQNLSQFFLLLKENGFGFSTSKIESDHRLVEGTLQTHAKLLYDMSGLTCEQQNILHIFSLIPGNSIPSEIKDWIQCNINDINFLEKKGWITYTREDNSYWIHDIVSLVVNLNTYPQDEWNTILSSFIHTIANNKAFWAYREKKIIQRRIEIAESVVQKYDCDSEEYYCACNTLAEEERIQARYDRSEDYHRIAWKCPYRTQKAKASLGIGLVQKYRGHFQEAINYIMEAQKLFTDIYGSTSKEFAHSFNTKGNVFEMWQKPLEAINEYNKALSIFQALTLNDEIANTKDNLALVHAQIKDFDRAKQYSEEAFELYKSSNNSAKELPAAYINMGEIYRLSGDFKKAYAAYKNSYNLKLKIYDGKHPSIAISLYNMALVLKEEWPGSSKRKAKKYCKKALSIFLDSYGEKHPYTCEAKDLLDCL